MVSMCSPTAFASRPIVIPSCMDIHLRARRMGPTGRAWARSKHHLQEEGARLAARRAERVGERFHGGNARALHTHALRELDPVEDRATEIEEFAGDCTGLCADGEE